jgi:hypothetical protein
VVFRIDEVKAGRELMRRIRPVVASAAHPASPAGDTWVSVALSFQGLKALGVRQASLDSFSPEFQQGMTARAAILGDTDESSPNIGRSLSGPLTFTSYSPRPLRIPSGWKRRSRGPARSTRRSPGLPPSGGRIVMPPNAAGTESEELLAAKMMGRWRSGAPLARCPLRDDPELGADRRRNNAFLFKEDDAIGYQTPCGSHIRRMNPRDADVAGVVRIHRMIRRGTSYGPLLPDGVLEDDGREQGLMFAFVGANLGRQFEFVQSEWMNDGSFFGGGATKDPVAGANSGADAYGFPRRPLAMRVKGLSRFVVTRGGEYCFLPGLRALRWLGEFES